MACVSCGAPSSATLVQRRDVHALTFAAAMDLQVSNARSDIVLTLTGTRSAVASSYL